MLKAIQQSLRKAPFVHKTIRSLWTPPERLYRHLYFDGGFTVEVERGARFKLFSHGEQVENDLFWAGFGNGWEGNCLKVWREMVRGADFIADVGANTGVFALAAQAMRPDARILAVEPSARVFAKLTRNIALNGFPIIAADCAASDQTGSATFYDFPGEHQYSASLEKAMHGTVEITVPVTRLDDLLEREGFVRLDAMKLDVEMHEPAALRGMRQTLASHRPAMLVEVLNDSLLAEIKETLSGLEYSYRQVQDDGHGSERNYLIAPTGKIAEIEIRLQTGILI